jgi:hypothetical protein
MKRRGILVIADDSTANVLLHKYELANRDAADPLTVLDVSRRSAKRLSAPAPEDHQEMFDVTVAYGQQNYLFRHGDFP